MDMVDALKYARYCGPTAVGSALGLSPSQAACYLNNMTARNREYARTGATDTDAITEALGFAPRMTPPKAVRGWPRWRLRPSSHFPTVAQWLKANPTKEALLMSRYHVIHVRGGEVVADTQASKSKRMRVIWYWDITNKTIRIDERKLQP